MSQERHTTPDYARQPPEEAHAARLAKLLPAWFCERMAFDNWHFGLLLTTGQMLHIATIQNVHQSADGGLWLDVELLEPDSFWNGRAIKRGWPAGAFAPTARRVCSVNVAHVVCAVELADT
jgi:hypothetical protein